MHTLPNPLVIPSLHSHYPLSLSPLSSSLLILVPFFSFRERFQKSMEKNDPSCLMWSSFEWCLLERIDGGRRGGRKWEREERIIHSKHVHFDPSPWFDSFSMFAQTSRKDPIIIETQTFLNLWSIHHTCWLVISYSSHHHHYHHEMKETFGTNRIGSLRDQWPFNETV